MKSIRTITLVVFLSIIVLSCEKDEPFHQVKAFETALHNNISNYRVSQGKTALVWFPDIFVEAREQAEAWKKSGDVNTGINERVGIIQDHWAPSNLGIITGQLIGKADTTNARLVLNSWAADSSLNETLLDDFVQSGVGIAESEDLVYIVHFLMKIPTK